MNSIKNPWGVYLSDDGLEIHVVPYKDTDEHYFIPECPCKPRTVELENGVVMFVHNSFDGRENFEVDSKVRMN